MKAEERVKRLREKMRSHGLDGYIVYGTDPHQSEYIPAHWQQRHWLTGFHGSAGTALVTGDEAALWTDSRYYLEAEQALAGTPFRLQRADEPDTPSLPDYLAEHLPEGARVGCAAETLALREDRRLRAALEPHGISFTPGEDLVAAIWSERPPLPADAAFEVSVARTGLDRSARLTQVRQAIERHRADALLVTALDDVAWTLNLRGADIPHNPVVFAYLLLERTSARLFIDPRKLDPTLRERLREAGVDSCAYEEIDGALRSLPEHSTLMADPAGINMRLVQALPQTVKLVEEPSPVARLKAVKNSRELTELSTCLRKDGAAMVQFLHWLASTWPHEAVTERRAAARLFELRSAQPEFMGNSFEPISAYGEHGAIVHYRTSEATDRRLEAGGLYLIDSGGQYLDGTTDITRTVAIGEPDDRMRTDYTLVLQAHIALATTPFVYGTTGTQLDALTRAVLWRHYRNYGHGTGHGIGFFLNVHEGPQRMSTRWNSVRLEPGMVMSNEPGVYRSGAYGIRIENMVAVAADRENAFGSFLRLETLTLCPLDRTLIEVAMLSAHEREWVNRYHLRVYQALEPHLDTAARVWLSEQTAAL